MFRSRQALQRSLTNPIQMETSQRAPASGCQLSEHQEEVFLRKKIKEREKVRAKTWELVIASNEPLSLTMFPSQFLRKVIHIQ